jgi:hypothetical protein
MNVCTELVNDIGPTLTGLLLMVGTMSTTVICVVVFWGIMRLTRP